MQSLMPAPDGGMLAKGPDQCERYMYSKASPSMAKQAQVVLEGLQRIVPLAAAALKLCLRDSRITSTVVRMSQPERIHQTLELSHYPIPVYLWDALDSVGFDVTNPYVSL